MSIPADHHYLPQFYLSGWAGVEGKFFAYRRPHERVILKHQYPAQEGYQKHLYSMLTQHDPVVREIMELKFFSQVDREAPEALRYLRKHCRRPDDARLRNAWSRFIMTMMHRSPARVSFLRGSMRGADQASLRQLEKQYPLHRGERDPPTYAEFVASADPAFIEKWEINLLRTLCDSQKVGTRLNEMTWDLVRRDDTTDGFMTSDTAVLGGKLGQLDGYLVLPVSPQEIFLLTNTAAVRRRFLNTPTRQLERLVNHDVVRFAEALVISSRSDQATFVERRLRKLTDKLHFDDGIYAGI